ncbi:MAG: hypothetical protein AAF639_37615 [Chloroflexota bacterium]
MPAFLMEPCPLQQERVAQTVYDFEPLVPTPMPGSSANQPLVGNQLQYQAGVQRRTPPIIAPAEKSEPYSLRWRIGVGIPDFNPQLFDWPAPRPGWYLSWSVGLTETLSTQNGWFGRQGTVRTLQMDAPDYAHIGMEFLPMVRVRAGALFPPAEALAQYADENQGRIWLIGNEPDVRWQDNTTPEAYVTAYHDAYHAIKQADPTAQVAIAGISQITPLRLAYLECIWQSYQATYGTTIPVDVWTMHAFVLPEISVDKNTESEGAWGVGIPPGYAESDLVALGMQWNMEDHTDLRLVENQVRLMRWWMNAHGQREKPLYITEYGVLMPPSYGYTADVVSDFMVQSFDLFDQLRDPKLGYSADDHRLVQRWTWFSTFYRLYPAGNLFNSRGRPTQVMDALNMYLDAHEP